MKGLICVFILALLMAACSSTPAPLPTAAAPNPGDPTTIALHLHLSCVESDTYYQSWDYQTSLSASVSGCGLMSTLASPSMVTPTSGLLLINTL